MCYDFGLISGPLLAGGLSGGAAAGAGGGAVVGGVTAGTTAASIGTIGGGVVGSSIGASAVPLTGSLVAVPAASTFLTAGNIGLATSLASSLVSGVGAVGQGIQQKSAYEANAKTQEMQARDAHRRGSVMEGQAREQSKMVTGAVNARQGSSGVIAGQDTGTDILAESAEFGARDAATINANAIREAWGLNTQASNDRFQGGLASKAGYLRGGATFLSGVSNAFAPTPPWWEKWKRFMNEG